METKKVKCINDKIKIPLTIGEVYDVINEDNIVYYIKDNEKCIFGYNKENFDELISDNKETNYIQTSTTAIDPKHYQLPIEPKDFIIKNELGFCEGNVIKYICRYKQKNGVEDLKKAKQYIDFLIDEIETKNNR